VTAIMDRINFDEHSGYFGERAERVLVPLLPPAEAGEAVAPEYPFHRGETRPDTFLSESMMKNLGALVPFATELQDSGHDLE